MVSGRFINWIASLFIIALIGSYKTSMDKRKHNALAIDHYKRIEKENNIK